jgi:translation initiation factor eIF-2B subunit beta
LEDMHKNINEQAVNHIHSGEIILTSGRSRSVELFLKAAAAKKRDFRVIVCEGAPFYGGHAMAVALSDAGIDTIVVNDSAVFAVMARVNKVLLPAHAVLANGGLIASSGCNLVALAARHNSVPVVCTTGLFKLCPIFPHEGQDTLNDLVSPSSVTDYADMNEHLLGDVEFINPVHDYIKPEHINLYITNVGSFQPSFIYRLLAEYYHTDDWASFDS